MDPKQPTGEQSQTDPKPGDPTKPAAAMAAAPGPTTNVNIQRLQAERLEALEDEEEQEAPSVAALEARIAALEAELAESEARVVATERRYEIDRVLADAGALDAETARVMTETFIEQMQLDDVAEAVELLRERKPFLFSRGSAAVPPGLPSGASAGAAASPGAADLEDMAEEARSSGARRELLRYLRARRGG